MVALQILTLPVWVQILVPQPYREDVTDSSYILFSFLVETIDKGIIREYNLTI